MGIGLLLQRNIEMNLPKTYKIILIEPSLVIQQGIKRILQFPGSEFEIDYCFRDYQSFADCWKKDSPNILLMNPSVMSSYKSFSVQNLFSEYSDTVFIALLYNYVKPSTVADFDGTIGIYDKGESVIKNIKKALDTSKFQKQLSGEINLSDREKEILISVTKGLTNKEIAEKLNISTHTVISHRKNITKKTGIKTVSGLTIYAISNRLILQ